MAARPAAPPAGLRGAIDLSPLVNRPAAEPQRRAAAPDDPQAAPVVVEVGDAELPRLVELSRTVPVLVALVADWSTPSQQLLPVLQRAVEALSGRMVLAIVDQPANPQSSAAFQAQAVPTVAAIIAGSPVPLFQGSIDEERLTTLLDRLLELAQQNGVDGRLGSAPEAADGEEPQAAAEPEPPAEPPLHFEAYEAIERQDYAEAARLFRLAIAQDPRDHQAVAALAQVELLDRVQSIPEDARTRAADDFRDLDAALATADMDIAGGHVDDAFDRLLGLVPSVHGDERNAVRTRLLDYFEIVGADDPRVAAARRRLAMLLY